MSSESACLNILTQLIFDHPRCKKKVWRQICYYCKKLIYLRYSINISISEVRSSYYTKPPGYQKCYDEFKSIRSEYHTKWLNLRRIFNASKGVTNKGYDINKRLNLNVNDVEYQLRSIFWATTYDMNKYTQTGTIGDINSIYFNTHKVKEKMLVYELQFETHHPSIYTQVHYCTYTQSQRVGYSVKNDFSKNNISFAYNTVNDIQTKIRRANKKTFQYVLKNLNKYPSFLQKNAEPFWNSLLKLSRYTIQQILDFVY